MTAGFLILLMLAAGCIWSISATAATFNTTRLQSPPSADEAASELACPPEVVHDRKFGPFQFPRTSATPQGTLAYAPCPHDKLHSGAHDTIFIQRQFQKSAKDEAAAIQFAGIGMRYCYANKTKGEADTACWVGFQSIGCRSRVMETVIDSAQDIVTRPVTVDNIQILLDHLTRLGRFAPYDYLSATTLVETINHALKEVNLFNDKNPELLAMRQTIFRHLTMYTRKVHLGQGQSVQVISEDIKLETLLFPEDDAEYSYTFESFVIPSEVVRRAQGSGQTKGSPRLQMIGYSDALFAHWGSKRKWDVDEALVSQHPELQDQPLESQFNGVFRIYDIHFSGLAISNLTVPVSYTFNIADPEDFQWICVFWNISEGTWSKDGIKTVRVNGSVRCESTHLTAFSVLLDPIPSENPLNPSVYFQVHDHILSVISSFGSAMSILGLSLTLLTYSLVRSLRRERSNQLLLNLALSLLFLHLFSLFAEKGVWAGACALPASLLHYFLLTSFTWMLIDAVFMYRILITVFVRPESKFFIKRLLIGWGIPLAFVGLTALIDASVYTEARNTLCVIAAHLNLPLFYATYLGPSFFILSTNTFVFGRIILVLCQQNRKKRRELREWEVKRQWPSLLSPIQVKGALTLFVVFGLGWILGFGAIGPLEIPGRYVHTILNSGQGLLLFILRVLLDVKVTTALYRSLWPEWDMSYMSRRTSGTDASVNGGCHGRSRSGTDASARGHEPVIHSAHVHEENSVIFSCTPESNKFVKLEPFVTKVYPLMKKLRFSLESFWRRRKETELTAKF